MMSAGWPYLAVYVVLSRVVDRTLWDYRRTFWTMSGVLTMTALLGPRVIAAVLTNILTMYVTLRVTRSRLMVWLAGLLLIGLRLSTVVPLHPSHYPALYAGLAMLQHRQLSYCLTVLDHTHPHTHHHTHHHTHSPSLTHLLTYCFYLPLYLAGPFLTYEQFSKQVNISPEWSRHDIMYTVWRCARIILWTFFNELVLHYFYFGIFNRRLVEGEDVDLFTLCSYHMAEACFFFTKYVSVFGIAAQVARLDGVLVPDHPQCVMTISYYSHMWKTFDRGLYDFCKMHIYVPLGGGEGGLLRQVAAITAVFTYIGWWHGGTVSIFMWAWLNQLEVLLEVVGTGVTRLTYFDTVRQAMSPVALRRCQVVCTVPLVLLAWLTQEAFFNGTHTAMIYLDKFLISSTWPQCAAVCYFTYCFVQCSLQCALWEPRVTLYLGNFFKPTSHLRQHLVKKTQ